MSKTPRHPISIADSNPACSLEHRRVLLLEDAPDDDRHFLTYLQQAGAEVTLQCSGEAVLDSIASSTHDFDAIVMAVQTPNVDGMLVARELRDRGFTGALVAVAKDGSSTQRRRWLHAGCDSLLAMPLDAETLVRIVRAHMVAASDRSLPPMAPANTETATNDQEIRVERASGALALGGFGTVIRT